VEDFGVYWTATKVNQAGGNAYDERQLLEPQQEIEPALRKPIAAWSPPWTFGALAPLTAVDFAAARWLWRIFQLATVLAAVTALWQIYGGPPNKLLWVWGLALIWYPTRQTLLLGQHSNLVFAGLVGWLACLAAQRRFLAGAFLALVLVKPQNLNLVVLLIAISIVDRRDWRMAAGGLAGTLLFTLLTLWQNPLVAQNYVEAITNRPPAHLLTPLPGTFLRMAFGYDQFWLTFVAPLIGMLWGIWYYFRNRLNWSWPERLPLLVIVSWIASPYGWMYDQLLFLIPIVAVLAPAAQRTAWFLWGISIVASLAVLAWALHSTGLKEHTFFWHAPVVLGLYLLGRKALNPVINERPTRERGIAIIVAIPVHE
jgi:hypothetical protein